MVFRKNKGQMSLEMVIGLIILLVVAGVVISLLLYFLDPANMPSSDETVEKRDFRSACETYCNDRSSTEYCTTYFKGSDWNGNGVRDELVTVGNLQWLACEDRVYCFLEVPCTRFGKNPIEGCIKEMCTNYKTKYKGLEDYEILASLAVMKNIIPAGEDSACPIYDVDPIDNWYLRFFNNEEAGLNICNTSSSYYAYQ